MKALYDNIGLDYSNSRRTDERISAQIHSHLAGASRIINIGAGTGSYEPEHIDLVAVEPSAKMIAQRKSGAHKAVQAVAENLPFENNSFSHALTILSMHHWQNKEKAFAEINRVTREKFIAVSWNPAAKPFWLTRDYFPEIYEKDIKIFPSKDELSAHFDDVQVSRLMIPADCTDGFLAAFWKRPEVYLIENVRQSISAFAKMKDPSKGLQQLSKDLENGEWANKNNELSKTSSLDVGYVIISAKVRNT